MPISVRDSIDVGYSIHEAKGGLACTGLYLLCDKSITSHQSIVDNLTFMSHFGRCDSQAGFSVSQKKGELELIVVHGAGLHLLIGYAHLANHIFVL